MAKVALLIGVSEYEQGLNPLPNAAKDVEAMQRVLQHPDMGGFAETDITMLINHQRQDIEDAIYNLFANRQRDDLLLFYFSGHGITDDSGEFYLSTRLTRKDEGRLVPPTAVAASYIHGRMNSSRSRRQVVILDCCFSGAFAKGMTAKDAGMVDVNAKLGGEGRAILTASTSTQYAFEQESFDLSIYTHFLVEGIEKGVADRDNDGWVSVDELYEYVKGKVKETSPAMTPEFYPVMEGHKILLAKSPKDDPKLKYRKEAESRANQGKFSVFARKILDLKRHEWGLSPGEATEIEEEVLQPYREYERKRDEYEQALIEAVKQEYPFNEATQKDLKDYQQYLGLRDEDIASIATRVLTPRKTEYELNRNKEEEWWEQYETELEEYNDSKELVCTDDLSSEKGVDYTKLRDLLKVGQWKEADHETLAVMLKAADRVSQGWLDSESIENFPCTDLRTIDQLWVKYSKEHFGFSVQKRIFDSVNRDEGAFGERVGWRKKAGLGGVFALKTYDELTFSLDAPEGHLPFGWCGGSLVSFEMVGEMIRIGGMWVLFSRVEDL